MEEFIEDMAKWIALQIYEEEMEETNGKTRKWRRNYIL